MIDLAKTLRKLSNKEYRDSYLPARVRSTVALQIRQLRKKLKLTQKQFATAIGKSQSDVSHLEDPDGEQITVQTLLDIASALDVALVVKFASYPKFLELMSDMSPEALDVININETMATSDAPIYKDLQLTTYVLPRMVEAATFDELEMLSGVKISAEVFEAISDISAKAYEAAIDSLKTAIVDAQAHIGIGKIGYFENFTTEPAAQLINVRGTSVWSPIELSQWELLPSSASVPKNTKKSIPTYAKGDLVLST